MSLFNVEEEDNSMSFLQDQKKGQDGLYRIDHKKAADPKKGYISVIRLLPWIIPMDQESKLKEAGIVATPEGEILVGPNAIKRVMTYVKLPEAAELQGYYDSPSNFGENDDLAKTYFTLDKSPNPVLKDRAKSLNKVTKYYSYAMVIEDKQQPELEGQIVIFQYGWKIAQKIEAEWNAENADGTRCKVYDLAEGKDLKLIVKEVGGYANYDASFFMERSSIKVKGKPLPTETLEGKNKAGAIITKKVIKKEHQDKLMQFLLNRKNEMIDYAPKRLTDDQQNKISQIIKVLTGKPTSGNELFNAPETTTAEELFDEKPKANVKKETPKASTPVKEVEEDDPFADVSSTEVSDDEDPFAGLD